MLIHVGPREWRSGTYARLDWLTPGKGNGDADRDADELRLVSCAATRTACACVATPGSIAQNFAGVTTLTDRLVLQRPLAIVVHE